MDRHAIAIFIPIIALAIPLSAIVLVGIQKIMRLRIEEARVRSGAVERDTTAEIAQLNADVDDLRQELAEVHERLDFAERLLSRSADRAQLERSP